MAVWKIGKPKARRDRLSGDLILEYSALNSAGKRVGIIVLIVLAITLPLYFVITEFLKGERSLSLLLMVVPVTMATVQAQREITRYFGSSYRIMRGGIKRQIWSKELFIRWDEVDSVYFSAGFPRPGSCFTITSSKGTIRVPLELDGLQDFAKSVKDNLPFEKWRKAEKHIDGLLDPSV
ncbi:MAG: hypothetical protein IBX64_01525 [Actinobacteria bacterium]|nr:hypothetical protein [Actinomycetota bacterium]